uniref:hypothetical protein n=1 Tax=Priestia megaterium TaxID=1404 RepID=UPI001C997BDD
KTLPPVKHLPLNFSTPKPQIQHDNQPHHIIKELSKPPYTPTLLTTTTHPPQSPHHKRKNPPIIFSGILIPLRFIRSHTPIASYM